MKVMSIDPGAERMGFAVVERNDQGKPVYLNSHVVFFSKGDEKYQENKLNLIASLAHWFPPYLGLWNPDEVVSETVPAVGSQGFMASGQSYLTNAAITVIHTIAILKGYPVSQIGATTVQSRIAQRGKSKSVPKPQVRNGVIQILPELQDRKSDWVKVFEEPDAIAVGLTRLGFKI